MSELRAKAALVESVIAAINGGDVEALVARCTPDAEFHSLMAASEGRVYRGAEGMRQYLADRAEAWSSFQLEIVGLRAAGLAARAD